MPENFAIIYMFPNKFSIYPALPKVWVPSEPLVLAIDWTNNNDEWDWVRVQNFTGPTLQPVNTLQSNATFYKNQNPMVNEVKFTALAPDEYFKYELVYRRNNGEEFIVDPTMLVRKIG